MRSARRRGARPTAAAWGQLAGLSARAQRGQLLLRGRCRHVDVGVMRHGQLHVLGKSSSTGPGRPWRVSSKARLTTAATSSTARTWVFHLVTEREMPMASHSWKASVPIAAVATWPLMHSTGIESHMASSRPEVVLAMPDQTSRRPRRCGRCCGHSPRRHGQRPARDAPAHGAGAARRRARRTAAARRRRGSRKSCPPHARSACPAGSGRRWRRGRRPGARRWNRRPAGRQGRRSGGDRSC